MSTKTLKICVLSAGLTLALGISGISSANLFSGSQQNPTTSSTNINQSNPSLTSQKTNQNQLLDQNNQQRMGVTKHGQHNRNLTTGKGRVRGHHHFKTITDKQLLTSNGKCNKHRHVRVIKQHRLHQS